MKSYGEVVGNMSGKKDLFTRIGAYLDLPAEVLPGGFSVLLSGERELCVRGHSVICSYSEKQITLALGARWLTVEGEGLFCAELSEEKVLIIGTVTGLFFKREGRNAT